MKTIKDMERLYPESIYLVGSKMHIRRTVYKKQNRFYVIWCDKPIEVIKSSTGYSSVESY